MFNKINTQKLINIIFVTGIIALILQFGLSTIYSSLSKKLNIYDKTMSALVSAYVDYDNYVTMFQAPNNIKAENVNNKVIYLTPTTVLSSNQKLLSYDYEAAR